MPAIPPPAMITLLLTPSGRHLGSFGFLDLTGGEGGGGGRDRNLVRLNRKMKKGEEEKEEARYCGKSFRSTVCSTR